MRKPFVVTPLESRLLLADFAATSGVTYSNSINWGEDNYTINAEAGERIVIQLNPASNAYVNVRGPGDQILYSLGGWSRTIAVTAAVSGSHRIQLFDPGFMDLDYSLTLFVASQTQGGDETAEVVSAKRRVWTFGSGDMDVSFADLDAGDSVHVSLSETSAGAVDPRMYVIDPSGAVLDTIETTGGTVDSFVATTAGRYHFVTLSQVVNVTGEYAFAIGVVPGTQDADDPDTAALTPGVVRSGELFTGDLDVFSISVPAGTAATITLTPTNGASLDPDVYVYNADGSSVTHQTAASISVDVSAPDGGAETFYVLLRDESGLVGGTYDIRYSTTLTMGGLQLIDNVLTVDGTDGNDIITITRSGDTFTLAGSLTGSLTTIDATSLLIRAGGGNDKVILTDAGLAAYVAGGGGDDTVFGTAFADALVGGAGRNRLYGNDGDDRLNGSAGRDMLWGGGGNDRLYGNAGNDVLDGGGNIDRLYGGDGDDLIYGGGSNDKLYAGAGNDILFGGAGRDLLYGEAGDDTAKIDAGDIIDSIEVTL